MIIYNDHGEPSKFDDESSTKLESDLKSEQENEKNL